MSEQGGGLRRTDEERQRLGEAIALVEQALLIVDATGLSIAAARIDHALSTLRAEIAETV